MDKYSKSINILIEDILNEAKTAHIKSYDRSKKVYDEAFKKGLSIWEKKANSKGYAPCKPAEALKFFKKRIDFKDEYTKIKELEKITNLHIIDVGVFMIESLKNKDKLI